MAFQVLHMQKINHAALSGVQSHNRREHESKTNKDIDYSRSGENFELENISNGMTYNRAFKNRLEEVGYTRKLRNDVVGCGSFVISASAEFFEGKSNVEIKQYFEDASEFVKGKYGAENVLYASVHLDENTPHMHMGIVPITENGKLSAKEVFSKQNGFDMLQTEFNAFLNARGYDLEKGQKTENTKHLSEIEYKVDQEELKLKIIESDIVEFEATIMEQETVLETLTKQVEDKIGHVQYLDKQVEWSENETEKLQTELTNLNQTLIERKDDLSMVNFQFEEAKVDLQEIEKETDSAEKRLNAFQSDLSKVDTNMARISHINAETPILNKNKRILDKEDYFWLQSQAKATPGLKIANQKLEFDLLQEKNRSSKLQHWNSDYQKENGELREKVKVLELENKTLKQFVKDRGLLDGFKEWFKQKLQERQQTKDHVLPKIKKQEIDRGR